MTGKEWDDASDDQLVERYLGGERRAFEALVRRHQDRVYRLCLRTIGNPSRAEEAAQEVFVKVFFGLRRFEGRAQFRTWLQRIKVNHCLNHLRKTRGATMVDIDEAEIQGHGALRTPPTAHVELQAVGDREQIVGVLDAMSDTLRIPLMLRDGDGLSYEEIADQLGIGLSAVKMRIKRARQEFRERFAGASVQPGSSASVPAGAP